MIEYLTQVFVIQMRLKTGTVKNVTLNR